MCDSVHLIHLIGRKSLHFEKTRLDDLIVYGNHAIKEEEISLKLHGNCTQQLHLDYWFFYVMSLFFIIINGLNNYVK